MDPKVSVIITTYNRQDLLRETIASILGQTFSNFELIIIDNFSEYDFEKFIHSFNDIRIIGKQNNNNGLIGVNRNLGISLAKAEFISFCDDDDIWEPHKLEHQLKIMETHPKVDMCCTASLFINNPVQKSGLRKMISHFNTLFLSLNIVPAKYILLMMSFITHSSVMYRKKTSVGVGPISENPAINTILDFDYYFRMSLSHKVFFLNKKLVQYRLHDNQISYKDVSKTKRKADDVIVSYWQRLNILQKIIFNLKKMISKLF
jgi:glycosyltransferase involved in cell wall biosynthesis